MYVKKEILFISSSQHFIDMFLKNFINRYSEKYNFTLVSNFDDKNSFSKKISIFHFPIKRKISLLIDIILFFPILRVFRKIKPHILVTVTPKSIIYGSFIKIFKPSVKRVHIYTGFTWSNMNGLKRNIFIILDKINIYFSDKIIFDSKDQINYLIKNNFNNKNFFLIHKGSIQGVNTNIFYKFENQSKINLKKKYKIPLNEKIILYMGRLDPDKGIFQLIKSFRNLKNNHPKINLLLVGKDEMNIKNYISNDDSRIIIMPHVSKPQEIYNICDIYCLPSKREGFGNVIIESSACEVPVVASNIFGLGTSLINNFNGLTFEVNNIDDLTSKLHLLISDDNLCSKLGKNGRDYVIKNFQPDDVLNSLEKLITN